MSQLRASRPGLGVCVVICIFLFLYLRNPVPEDPEEGPASPGGLECGFYPDELCSALFEGKPAAPQLAKFCKISHQSQILAHLHTSGNCSGISQGLRFITKPLSAEEGNFPLAYIITVPKEPASLVQLLRAVYAPQNAYCIHADREASEQARAAAQTLAGCFENIFISSEREKATSAAVTRLEADINCMEDLAHPKFQWNYVIKLCGQDFPIKTNREVIHYLRSRARDKNITPVKAPKATSTTRPRHPDSSAEEPTHVSPNRRAHAEPPHNITVHSGSAYFALTRKFVEFVLTDIRAKDLLQWSKDVERPEQHYWVTLNRLPDAPGATPHAAWEGHICAIKWRNEEGRAHNGCKGHYVQDACVYGPGDLPWIIRSPSLFAHKFESSADPLVVTCLERWHRRQVLEQAEVPLEPQWHFQEERPFP